MEEVQHFFDGRQGQATHAFSLAAQVQPTDTDLERRGAVGEGRDFGARTQHLVEQVVTALVQILHGRAALEGGRDVKGGKFVVEVSVEDGRVAGTVGEGVPRLEKLMEMNE